MVNILDMHRRHGGFAWHVYDERFRRVRALRPSHTSSTHGPRIEKYGLCVVLRRTFVRIWRKLASWQRMHSVLLAHWAYAMRMHSAYRAHVLKKSTSAQRVAGAMDEWPAHEVGTARARPAHAARARRTASERHRSDDCAYKMRRRVLLAVISK